jgi:site-specific recombinase XerD
MSNYSESQRLSDLVDYYEVCNRSEGKSPRTITWYSANLRQFLDYLESRNLPDVVDGIDVRVVREYIDYLLGRNRLADHRHCRIERELLSRATVHGHVRTLKAFLRWLFREGFVQVDISANLRLPKVPDKIISALSDEEIRSILSTFSSGDLCDVRNKTIFMILIDTGLRIGELINLKMDDVRLGGGVLKVMGKGQKERIVPIGNNAQRALHKYLLLRPRPAHAGVDNIFLSIHGKALSENSMKLMFARLSRRSKVERLHAHLCRHTFATRFLMNGGDIFTLQRILGHSSLEMVRHYANLASSYMVLQHQKFSPLDRLNLSRV